MSRMLRLLLRWQWQGCKASSRMAAAATVAGAAGVLAAQVLRMATRSRCCLLLQSCQVGRVEAGKGVGCAQSASAPGMWGTDALCAGANGQPQRLQFKQLPWLSRQHAGSSLGIPCTAALLPSSAALSCDKPSLCPGLRCVSAPVR